MRALLLFVWVLTVFIVFPSKAQTVFTSLESCIRYAREHNADVAVASRNAAIAANNRQRSWYNLLPQVNAYSTLDYNFELQTQLLPAELFGGPKGTLIPVQFGTRYNLTGVVEAKVPLVSPAKWNEVKVGRLKEQQSAMELQQQQEQLNRDLTIAYYQSILAHRSWQIAQEQQLLADSLAGIVHKRFREGVAGPVEYQRSRQLALDASVTRQQQFTTWRQRLNDLRQLAGMGAADSLVIEDSLPLQTLPVAPEAFQPDQLAAVKAGRLQQEVDRALWQQDRSRNLPELSLYARYGKMAQRNKFDFGASDARWFGLGVVGLRLDIPIFQPATQRSAVRQSRLQYEISSIRSRQVQLNEDIRWNNWYEQYMQCLRSIPDARESAVLARDNYHKTLLQFEDGITGVDQAIERYKDVLETQWKSQQLLIQLYQTYILLKNYQRSET